MILFFVGMPGCGKSTTGRGFADITGIPFLDLDQMIEKSEQEKISKIFETRGEEYFRDIETKKLESLNKEDGITIMCSLHFLSLARAYADRIIALKDGYMEFDGDPSEIDEQRFRDIYGEDAVRVEIS